MAKQLGIPYQTVKTVFRRLIEKKIVKKQQNKRGVGGFCCFKITESVKSCVLKNIDLFSPKRGSERGSSATYVSSSYINTTTEEEEKNSSNLPPEWSYIDYSALESYGFDEARLIQIHRTYKNNPDISLTPNIIQDSITHFAYDLEHNNAKANFRHPPVAVITSMLKKGAPYSSTTPHEVKTPREIAMLKYLESKSAADAQNKAIEGELQKVELDTWLNAMTADEILDQFYGKEELEKIGNNKIRKTLAFRTAKENASEYFLMEIWPSKKQAILEIQAQRDAAEDDNAEDDNTGNVAE